MQEKDLLDRLFARYQQGIATKAEKTQIETWLLRLDLDDHPHDQRSTFMQQRSADELRAYFHQHSKKSTFRLIHYWVAASVVLLLSVGIWLYHSGTTSGHHHPLRYTEIRTGKGQLTTVQLADGSTVTLNNESYLRYPQVFDDTSREVLLTGEAFFEVTHDPSKPFRVRSGNLQVRVLGTSFDVSAYPGEARLSVMVATGKVGVTGLPGVDLLLLPGDRITYDMSNGHFDKVTLPPSVAGAWQQDMLVFRDEPLSAIATRLERRYPVKFVFQDPALRSRELSLTAQPKNLENILKALSISGDFRYRINGNEIILYP